MTKRTWKDHLLSSGLPLEQSVIQSLRKLDILDPREYKYERINEAGIPTLFSVDIHATRMGPVWLELFIECKYRHDGTRWVFTPDEFNFGRDEAFQDMFILLDTFAGGYSVDRNLINRQFKKDDLCRKGIEILRDDANPKSIEQSIQQIRYALVEESIDAIIHQVERLLGGVGPVFVLVPIIVTTAELWRLRHGITIEGIRKAADLQEIAERRDFLFIEHKPDNQLTRHTRARFSELLSDEDKREIDNQLKAMSKHSGYVPFVNGFSSDCPSRVMAVNYNTFEDLVKRLISIFDDPNLIKKQ